MWYFLDAVLKFWVQEMWEFKLKTWKNDITFILGWAPSKAKAKARPWRTHFTGDVVPGSKSEVEQAEWNRKRESSLIQVCIAEVSATGAGAQFQQDFLRNLQNSFQLFTCFPVGGRLEHPSFSSPPHHQVARRSWPVSSRGSLMPWAKSTKIPNEWLRVGCVKWVTQTCPQLHS